MYVCWDVHQDTYLDIWVRRVIIINDANYVSVVWFAKNASIGFTSDFQFYDYYTIHVHLLLYHWYSTSLVSCSYLIIPWVLPAWYHLFYIYLLLHAYAHDTVFNACLWFSFIDTHVLIFSRHLAFASPLAGGVLTPLGPHVQVLELGPKGIFLLRTKLVSPRGYTLQLFLCFDDDKPNKCYLVLMILFKMSFRFCTMFRVHLLRCCKNF